MLTDRIAELARGGGAPVPDTPAPNELISFELRADGGFDLRMASGANYHSAGLADLAAAGIASNPEHISVVAALVEKLIQLTPGKLLRAGTVYVVRRIRVGDGEMK